MGGRKSGKGFMGYQLVKDERDVLVNNCGATSASNC